MIELQKNTEITISFSGSDISTVIRIPSALEAEDILLEKYDSITLFSRFVSSFSCPDFHGIDGMTAEDMLNYPGSRALVLKVAEYIIQTASIREYYNHDL